MRKIYTAIAILLFAMSSFAQDLATDFITYTVPNQVTSTINADAHTITVIVPIGSDLATLTPDFTVSTGATAYIASVAQVSGTTVDFSAGAVTYTVENGTASQEWVVTASIEVGISEDVNLEVNVYPNPTTEYVTISNVEFATVSVYNVLGGLIQTINSNATELTINVSSYSKGTYLIRIQKGNQMVTKKVSVIK
jgi:hypothetical protein